VRPSEVLRRAEGYLDRHGVDSPRTTAEVLLAHVLGTDRAGLYARAEPLDGREAREYGRALCRRCEHVPLQHLTGTTGFRHLTLAVRPGVFIPRPETEVVVEEALEAVGDVEQPVVVDVGTGTGAIALSIAAERPDADVHAVDLSADAIELAGANASANGIDVTLHAGDLLEPLPPGLRGAVDVIVSNPPYVDAGDHDGLSPEVLADPVNALVGGTDVHRRLVVDAPGWLRAGGWLVMEIGDEQGDQVRALLDGGGFDDVAVRADLAGRQRVAVGRWPG
jgi:release factor glutamine methyltransferase